MPNQIESLEEGKKLKVTLETGEIFEGDPLEVTNKMAAAHVETKRWGQAAHAEVKTLKDKAPVTATQTATQVTATSEESQLRKYLLDQTAKELGYNSGEEYKADLIKAKGVTEKIANQAVAADFMQLCPDFPNDQKAIDALTEKVKELGYDWRPQDLVAAHMLCTREGKYKALTAQEQNESWANNMSVASRGTVPPMIRSSSPENAQPVDLYKEPLADQRARIIREQLAERGM